ncbi:MAG: hypothetical protein IKQ77_07040 [Prevotella sp.]|nr:hypothetical protein [Prevotella sp.]
MKKIFTLIALLTCFMGAKAADWVEVYKIDYSQNTGFPFYVMGYVPEWVDGVMTDYGANYRYATQEELDGTGDAKWKDGETSEGTVKTQGGTEYQKVTGAGPYWHQYFIADGIQTEIDGAYKVKAMVRASEACSINVNMGWGWSEGQQASTSVNIGTDWAEVEWEYSGIGGASCNLVAQPGTVTATIEWKYVIVEHFQKEQRPVQWLEWLTSDGQPVLVDGNPIPTYMGDAETPWPDPNVKFDDQEKNYLICAWSKERMRNMNEAGDGWDPFPADIEMVDGSHVFVCHGQAAITEGDASAWDNQFWIQSPKAWKSGDQVKIHFRYKASAPVSSTDTQIHYQNPSNYLIWHAIGNIAFTEEWQDFDGIMTIADDMAGGWSIAFNLNSQVKDAVTFYFDDLSWQSMKLDEGYFVAGCNPATGLEYDFDNAKQFVYDDEVGAYTATIGENGWVSQVMISTVRGNDAAFKSATLKPAGTIENDAEVWLDYTESSLAKLSLPGEGKWKIYLDDEYKKMAFEMLEGRDLKPVEIKPNPTLVTINALEREYTTAEAEALGIEAPATPGQPWDNQFWIVSNRPLSAGETTIVQFKYKSSIPAKASTQSHAAPGSYLHWAAIGDVNFDTDWQDFEASFTVASEADQMESIAFNLSEIKDANIYELKDFVWKTDDGQQSLIDQEGSKNFYVKTLGGNPEMFDDGTGISTVVTNTKVPTVTYNLAGQRVSKDYKGIVIKNGKKVVNK